MTILPVILCGGAGSRLWPASRPDRPKPFLALTHPHKTLLEQTLERISTQGFAPPLIVGNEAHEALIRAALKSADIEHFSLLLEPVARNTAASILLAAHFAQRHYGDEVRLLIMPSDHSITDSAAFMTAVCQLNQQLPNSALGLFGITPLRAETGYGYIECAVGAAQSSADSALSILSFTEKPPADVAQIYATSGRHFVNSGIFLFPLTALFMNAAQIAPSLLAATKNVWLQALRRAEAMYLPLTPMQSLPEISIDYAILQQSRLLQMQPLDCGWSDVGSWHGLWQALSAQPQRQSAEQQRPWGYFEPIYSADGFCVKRLWIRAGGALSLQYHNHRTEHWTVIRGIASIQCDDAFKTLHAGESIFIPKGMRHRIINEQPHEALEIIEIQQGAYLHEDDIIRLDDAYGRHRTLLTA